MRALEIDRHLFDRVRSRLDPSYVFDENITELENKRREMKV